MLINAALLDQPGWAAARTSGTVVEIESLTGIEFETREAREDRLDDTPLSQRVREADARDGEKEGDDDEAESQGIDPQSMLGKAEQLTLTSTGPHALLAGVKSLALESDYPAESWSLRMPYDNFVLTLARTPRTARARCSSSASARAASCSSRAVRCSRTARSATPTMRSC